MCPYICAGECTYIPIDVIVLFLNLVNAQKRLSHTHKQTNTLTHTHSCESEFTMRKIKQSFGFLWFVAMTLANNADQPAAVRQPHFNADLDTFRIYIHMYIDKGRIPLHIPGEMLAKQNCGAFVCCLSQAH